MSETLVALIDLHGEVKAHTSYGGCHPSQSSISKEPLGST